MSYFAITSNSVQCGADFTLDADVMGFGVHGSCGFDALIEFSPFRILTSVHFEVSIKAAGVDLIGVMLYVSLEGPNRWHVIGTAHFEVLGLGKDIRVDELIGPKQTEPPVAPANVLEDVIDALVADGAWQVLEAADPAVTLRSIDDSIDPLFAEFLATPDSVIELRQFVVPLGVTIEQYGNAPVGEHATFELAASGLDSSGPLDDWFAPGRYFALSKDDKLDGPEFERMRSGLRFGTSAADAGRHIGVDIGHVPYTIDPEYETVNQFDHAARNDKPCGITYASTSGVSFSASHTYTVASATSATSATSTTSNTQGRGAGSFPAGLDADGFLLVDRDGTVVDRAATWTAVRARRGSNRRLHIERRSAREPASQTEPRA